MASEEFFFDFEPKYFSLPKAVTEILNEVSFENLNELAKLSELEGLTMIRYDGKQPLTFSPDESRIYIRRLFSTLSGDLEISVEHSMPYIL